LANDIEMVVVEVIRLIATLLGNGEMGWCQWSYSQQAEREREKDRKSASEPVAVLLEADGN
jgi:hypothetical protein